MTELIKKTPLEHMEKNLWEDKKLEVYHLSMKCWDFDKKIKTKKHPEMDVFCFYWLFSRRLLFFTYAVKLTVGIRLIGA
jgi:hypothetical protein